MSQRKVILTMQMTLDGFVASPDGKADWLINDEETWKEMFKMLQMADTYLLGRKMYPEYSAYWQSVLKNPDSKGGELEFAKMADNSQHIVFTKGNFTPDWNNTKVAHDLKGEIENLKKQPGKDIVAWGGADFGGNLINLGLLDEIRIQLNPTAIGKGVPLFNKLDHGKKFILIDASPLKSGMVILNYKANT